MWGGEAGGGQDSFVEGDEEAFAAGEDGAVGALEFGLVEEFAVGCAVGFGGAVEVAGYEDQRLVERGGPEVVDLHVAGHGEDVEGAVELAHGFVEERGDDAAVDVAGWAFVHAVELEVCGGGDVFGVGGVGGEDEVEALRVGGAAAEAVVGALVDGGGVHGGGGVAGGVGYGHGLVWTLAQSCAGMNSRFSLTVTALGGADFEDAGAEFFYFFVAEAVDGFELGESLRACEDDVAEGGGGEDEEEREAEFFGFGFAPFAEAVVEGLLFGGEGLRLVRMLCAGG